MADEICTGQATKQAGNDSLLYNQKWNTHHYWNQKWVYIDVHYLKIMNYVENSTSKLCASQATKRRSDCIVYLIMINKSQCI